jgi:3-oxoacyl-[acyl-carrier-protein] synthase II
MGVVSSVGLGREAFWDAIVGGRTGFNDIGSFDTHGLDRSVAGEVRGFVARDFLTHAETRRTGRCSAFALAAARQAVEDAGLASEQLSGERTSVIVGTTMGEADVITELENTWIRKGGDAVSVSKLPRYGTSLLPIHLARAFGARGMVQALPAACAAGNYAIAYAADLIRAGRADVVVTGASELLQKHQFAGFVRLGAVAPERCQPFDRNRKGIIIGEGAAIMVLESEAHAVRRGARALAEVGGAGLACDAHHITRPHPEGAGSLSAMREAIARSGITPDEVDLINAHGTGTQANDKIESLVVQQVFGGRSIPVTSLKSMIGHCMGAASALEAVACVMTIQTGMYPPTVSYETPDPECDVKVVANTAATGKADVVLNNSLAFGGYDAVVAFARPGVLPMPAAHGTWRGAAPGLAGVAAGAAAGPAI